MPGSSSSAPGSTPPADAFLHRFVELVVLPALDEAVRARRTVGVIAPPHVSTVVHRVTKTVTPAPADGEVRRVIDVDASTGPPATALHHAYVVEPPAPLAITVHRAVDVDDDARRHLGAATRRTIAVAAPRPFDSVSSHITAHVVPPAVSAAVVHRAVEVLPPSLRATLRRVVKVLAPFPSLSAAPRARAFSHTVLRRAHRAAADALPPLRGFDVNGAPLHDFEIVQPPAHGALELGADGVATYTRHDPTRLGEDFFTYVVRSATDVSEPARVRLFVKSAAQVVVKSGRAIVRGGLTGKRPRLVVADRVRMLTAAA